MLCSGAIGVLRYTCGMFTKLTRSKSRTYAQLVESFRDEQGQPRQRTVATLGRVDEDGGTVDAVLSTLLRAKGRSGVDIATPQVRFESALALGDVWALDQLWRELGFDALAAVFRRARYTTPIEQAIRVMVFNRLCDADSKLGTLRWLQTVSMPGVDADNLSHQQLLRSMDALMDHQEAVDDVVAGLLRPLIDQDLSLVFYVGIGKKSSQGEPAQNQTKEDQEPFFVSKAKQNPIPILIKLSDKYVYFAGYFKVIAIRPQTTPKGIQYYEIILETRH